MTNAPEFKVGDTIYWYCRKDECMHHAEILFVNFARVEAGYLEVNYEVETYCDGEKRTLFIDDCDAMKYDITE